MCGIIGYTGDRNAAELLLEGLSRLEYRGYDSAGIAVLDGDSLVVEKRAGKLGVLSAAVEGHLPAGSIGVGHTRWATHGGVTDANAHPHLDCDGDVVVIHNGIVENFAALRDELRAAGHVFVSDTDTEIIPHLIESYQRGGAALLEAVRLTVRRIAGAAALVVMSRKEPDVIIGARVSNAGAVVVGYGEGEMLIASDLLGLQRLAQRVVFLQHGEIVRLTRDGADYVDASGRALEKQPAPMPYDPTGADRGPYRHFMQKEVFEQYDALLNTIRQYVNVEDGSVQMPALGLSPRQIGEMKRVVLLGMGTSLHAAMVGRAYFERIAGIPAEVDNASEFCYREPVLGPDTLVITVSQSGETVDTLWAMEYVVRPSGSPILTVCNVPGSTTTRAAGGAVITYCGPERAVASTKTYVASIAALYMLACWLGRRRGTLSHERERELVEDLERIPALVARTTATGEGENSPYRALARKYRDVHDVLFLGRGMQFPVAMEGALKLKEVSYIHAEGYSAGEMKHGPIALIDEHMPSVVLAPRDGLFDKMISNVQQLRARLGKVIAIGTEGDEELPKYADDVLWTPPAPPLLLPIVTSIPVQLLAYEVAVWRGYDVDQPRNLAKTVTVL